MLTFQATRNFLIYLSLLIPFTSEAKIVETARVADVLPYIDEETWFLIDLDNTLFEAKQSLGHADWFYDELQVRMQKGMSRDEAIKDAYPGWIKTQAVCPVKPLEENFIPLLLSLQNRGVVVMGLTHRQPFVAESTVRQVKSLGLDFKRSAPAVGTIACCSVTPIQYLEGILFVGDYNKKGDIFLPFLSAAGSKPGKIVFIDDKRKNVDELENALQNSGIEYVGIHYTAIDSGPKVYSREIAEFQLRFLDRIMSNEAAVLLMEAGLE